MPMLIYTMFYACVFTCRPYNRLVSDFSKNLKPLAKNLCDAFASYARDNPDKTIGELIADADFDDEASNLVECRGYALSILLSLTVRDLQLNADATYVAPPISQPAPEIDVRWDNGRDALPDDWEPERPGMFATITPVRSQREDNTPKPPKKKRGRKNEGVPEAHIEALVLYWDARGDASAQSESFDVKTADVASELGIEKKEALALLNYFAAHNLVRSEGKAKGRKWVFDTDREEKTELELSQADYDLFLSGKSPGVGFLAE